MSSEFELSLRTKGVSKKTARRYATIVEQTISKYSELTSSTAKTAILEQLETYSPASANKYVLAFKAYGHFKNLNWTKDLSKIKETPAPKRQPTIQLAREIINIPAWDTRDLKIHEKYSLLIELMFLTGMRLAEVRNLKVTDITEDEIIVARSKTGRGRRIATPPFEEHQNRLFSYLHTLNTVYAFPSEKYPDSPLSDRVVRKEFAARLKLLGVSHQITPHSFRGSFMTRNLRKGANLFDVQDIVGHTSSETTKIYYRGDLETQKQVMKLDPANLDHIADEELIAHGVEELRKIGIFQRKTIFYQISKDKIIIRRLQSN